jgi:hypothetical protein
MRRPDRGFAPIPRVARESSVSNMNIPAECRVDGRDPTCFLGFGNQVAVLPTLARGSNSAQRCQRQIIEGLGTHATLAG